MTAIERRAQARRRRGFCDTCHVRAWWAISIASGLRRCFPCWVLAYRRRNQVEEEAA